MTAVEEILKELGKNVVEDYFEDIEVGEVAKGIIETNINIIRLWRKGGCK